MDLKKLSPWNWFQKEQEQAREQQNLNRVPANRGGGMSRPSTAGDPITALHDQMQTLFDDVARQFGMPQWPHAGAGVSPDLFRPSVDIKENDKNYTLHLDMPGVNKDDVQVEVEGDALVVRGEKREEKDDSDDDYQVVERHYGAFQRILDLPDDADPEDLKARFDNGVLTITIARRPDKVGNARRIEVE